MNGLNYVTFIYKSTFILVLLFFDISLKLDSLHWCFLVGKMDLVELCVSIK
jgi:hypothetical protein